MRDYMYGIKKGIPIALGYLSVSFTFGVKAVNGGIPAWAAVLISLTNLTSAGQFAGTNLILEGSGYLEMAVTTLVINLRYMLMSLALSQKIEKRTALRHRLVMGFGITPYFYGLMTLPILGWTGGTFLGAAASGLMPAALSSAMELGLYAMFIAIIIPPARKSLAITVVLLASVILSAAIYYLPPLQFISGGVRVIIAAILASLIGAVCFPLQAEREEEKHVSSD